MLQETLKLVRGTRWQLVPRHARFPNLKPFGLVHNASSIGEKNFTANWCRVADKGIWYKAFQTKSVGSAYKQARATET